MIAALALAAAASAFQPPPLAAEAIRVRIAACGIAGRHVSVRYRRELQDFGVTIGRQRRALADAVISCVAQTAYATGHWTEFEDRDADRRYRAFEQGVVEREGRARSRQWLRERGRLDDLPAFDPERQSADAFGAALETFCGAPAGTMLRFHEGLFEILLAAVPSEEGDERLICLVNALGASNLREHGLAAGFIARGAPEDR
jgi:hypothetical protein